MNLLQAYINANSYFVSKTQFQIGYSRFVNFEVKSESD